LYKLYKIIEFEGHYLTSLNNIFISTVDNMSIYKNNSIIVNKNMYDVDNINFMELNSTDKEKFILDKFNSIFNNYSEFFYNYFHKTTDTSATSNYHKHSIINNPYKYIYFLQNNSIFNLLVLIFLSDNINLLNYFSFTIKNNKTFKLPDTLVILSMPNYYLISNYKENEYLYPIPLSSDENCNLFKKCEKNAYEYLKNYIKKLIYIEDITIYNTDTLAKSLAAQLII